MNVRMRPFTATMPRVRRTVLRVITAIQLTRLTMAFGAVSDVWFVILLTRAADQYEFMNVAQMHLATALFVGAAVAVGLFAYGAALNDILDVRHDRTFSPDRPIPAGRIRPGQAVVMTVGALLVSMLAAEAFGTRALWVAMLAAAAVLFYNAAGRFIPAVGVVTIGLIHAAHMLIPNVQLTFMLPVWMVMTHAMVIALLVHVMEDKRPRMNGRGLVATVVGWAFWSIVLLTIGAMRGGTVDDLLAWPLAAAPIVAVIGFALVARWKTRGVSGRVGAEKLKRYGAMWQSLYGASWLLALGLYREAMWIGLFALAGFTAMTLIKEVTGLTGEPISYRR